MVKPWHRWPPGLREAIFQRDKRRCQIQGPTCTTEASAVDHIVRPEEGGSWFDPSNLRASCRNCNTRRRLSGDERWRISGTHIVLVVGPPGAGKSTYVEQHRSPNDLVVDYDRIAEALGSPTSHDTKLHEATMAARNAVLRAIKQGRIKSERVWIVSSNPDAREKFPHHEVRVIDPGPDETKRRAIAAGRPAKWLGLIDSWYGKTVPTSRPW